MATMTIENESRQTAIASGSAEESRTSGPANEIPRSAAASTQPGDRRDAGDFNELELPASTGGSRLFLR
jgi:hypothetical protein